MTRKLILVSSAPYKGTNPIHEGPPSQTNHFLKASSPNNTILWGGGYILI